MSAALYSAIYTLLNRPRGLVVYAGNNSKWYGWAYYKQGSATQSGVKTGSHGTYPGSHSHLRRYTIKLNGGSEISVAAPKTLNKKVKRNDAFTPDSWSPAGYINWELLRDASGEVKAKPDSTGEFKLIGLKFKSLYSLPDHLVKPFSNVHDDLDPGGTKKDTKENFFQALEEVADTGLDFFAYAGHGGTKSLPSAGVGKSDINELADELRRIVKPTGTVIFYACSTGAPGGFASQISALLPSMTVWGHSDAGQASRNADKIRYQNGKGTDIRTLLSATAKSKFGQYLRSSPDFYARLPFMTIEAIESELTSA